MKLDHKLVQMVIQEVLLHKIIPANQLNIDMEKKTCYLLPTVINEIAEDVIKSLENLEELR